MAEDTQLRRSTKRRVERHVARGRMLHEAVVCLDELALGRVCEVGSCQRPSAAQQSVLTNIEEAISHMGAPPPELVPAGAFQELRGTPAYEDVPPSLGRYDLGLVSLPPCSSRPTSLEDLVGSAFAAEIMHTIGACLLSDSEASEKINEFGKKCYSDPLLRSNVAWGGLVRRLSDSNLVDFVIEEEEGYKEECGVFLCAKKNWEIET